MKISTILKTRGDWLSADGAHHPIVISSRVRLARNLAKLPFPGWAKKTERIRILDEIKPEVDNLAQMRSSFSEQLNELSALEKQVLVERHLISREHAAKGMGSAVAISSTQAISIMMNEEDHLRMQAIYLRAWICRRPFGSSMMSIPLSKRTLISPLIRNWDISRLARQTSGLVCALPRWSICLGSS